MAPGASTARDFKLGHDRRRTRKIAVVSCRGPHRPTEEHLTGSLSRASAAIVCIGFTLSAWLALKGSLPAAAVAGLVDSRSNKSEHFYSIVLNVRDAGAHGHARLVWTKHRSDDDRSAVAFGYYAGEVAKLADVFDTVGELKNETSMLVDPGQQTRLALVFWVDEAQFKATLARVETWRGSGRYRLFDRDCVTFVADVIEPLGLKMPHRLLLPTPTQYVVALSELNAQRPSR